jgi:hypothetical protein
MVFFILPLLAVKGMVPLWVIKIGSITDHWAHNYVCLQVTDKPVAVGFGISKPEHVKQVKNCYQLN